MLAMLKGQPSDKQAIRARETQPEKHLKERMQGVRSASLAATVHHCGRAARAMSAGDDGESDRIPKLLVR